MKMVNLWGIEKNMCESKIKQMRMTAKMTQKAFAEYFNIPKRTIEDWESERRTPPEYLVELMEYKLKNEKLI